MAGRVKSSRCIAQLRIKRWRAYSATSRAPRTESHGITQVLTLILHCGTRAWRLGQVGWAQHHSHRGVRWSPHSTRIEIRASIFVMRKQNQEKHVKKVSNQVNSSSIKSYVHDETVMMCPVGCPHSRCPGRSPVLHAAAWSRMYSPAKPRNAGRKKRPNHPARVYPPRKPVLSKVH